MEKEEAKAKECHRKFVSKKTVRDMYNINHIFKHVSLGEIIKKHRELE